MRYRQNGDRSIITYRFILIAKINVFFTDFQQHPPFLRDQLCQGCLSFCVQLQQVVLPFLHAG
jgi:hypothetical protein